MSVIEGYAFMGCENLTSMTIPQSVTEIGGGVFAWCDNLTNISVDSRNAMFVSMNNCIIYENEIIAVCNEFTIPSNAGITSIGKYAIAGVSATNITIPENITNLDFMCIAGCTDLKDIFYEGTTNDWASITKDNHWFMNNADCSSIHCTDEIISTAS